MPLDPGTGRAGRAGARLVMLLALIVITGIPFVAVLWETLNELLAAKVNPRRLAVSVPLLLVFLGILVAIGRALSRLEHPPQPPPENRG